MRLLADELVEHLAQGGVDLGDLLRGRRAARTDRPDRLVGDHRVFAGGALRQADRELGAHDVERPALLALLHRLADADDAAQTGPAGAQCLGVDAVIGLVMVGAPLGMADDDVGRAEIGEHLRRDGSGESAARAGMQVLAADGDGRTVDGGHAGGDQRRGRADQHVDLVRERGREAVADRLDDRNRGAQAVHLPVAGNQRTASLACHGVPVLRVSIQGLQRVRGPSRASLGAQTTFAAVPFPFGRAEHMPFAPPPRSSIAGLEYGPPPPRVGAV